MNSQKTNTLAIVGFILSLFLGPIGGIISIIALCQIKNTGEKGKGLAIAGIILGFGGIVLVVAIGAFFTILVWPGLQDSISAQTICANGAGYTQGTPSEEGYISCGWFDSDDKYTCRYTIIDDFGNIEEKTVTCSY